MIGTLGQPLPRKIAQLGQIFQLAFVPQDFAQTVQYWTQTIGAGPFFLLEHIKTENLKYLGKPARIDFTAALGYWNDIQIEIIKQHDDAPSIFSKWRQAGHHGLHHVCMLVPDIDHARALCSEVDAVIVQEMEAGGGASKIIYADTGGGPGTLIEMVQTDAARQKHFFAPMREAARNWDGTDPVRRLGAPPLRNS
jgi:hypothetical protein